jgi:hypothetical protein
MTNSAIQTPASTKKAEARSEYVFVTTNYHGRMASITSRQLFLIHLPGALKYERWSLPWGTSKVLRRHWDWLNFQVDGVRPNDPAEFVKSKQIILSIDGEDFFTDFARLAKTHLGAPLEGAVVINRVRRPDTLQSWLDLATNYSKEQANEILGFADYRIQMVKALERLKAGQAKPLMNKPLQPESTEEYGDQ